MRSRTGSAGATPSLRIRMLRHVMLPLVLIWLAGTAATLGVASHFTEQAFDRALLDDAYSIASHVRPNTDGRVALQLTAGELTAALFDQAEAVHFSVLRFEPAPLLLGYILGPMLEEHLRRAMLLSRGDPSVFVTRPISATLLALTAAMLAWAIWSTVRKAIKAKRQLDRAQAAAA